MPLFLAANHIRPNTLYEALNMLPTAGYGVYLWFNQFLGMKSSSRTFLFLQFLTQAVLPINLIFLGCIEWIRFLRMDFWEVTDLPLDCPHLAKRFFDDAPNIIS